MNNNTNYVRVLQEIGGHKKQIKPYTDAKHEKYETLLAKSRDDINQK